MKMNKTKDKTTPLKKTPRATKDTVLKVARKRGIMRPKDLDTLDIPRVYLSRMTEEGLLMRLARGLYAPATLEVTEHHSLAEACKRVPRGVICLLSALQFHGLTTQMPSQVWMALEPATRLPQGYGLPLRFVRFSGEAFTGGVETLRLEGVKVRVTNPAKTVADCFKFRNKIGLDVAMEALRDCWKQKKATMDDLWHYAKVCRVSNVMRPYMEALA
jgi:predicted transcriptional regulator of viral defense system